MRLLYLLVLGFFVCSAHAELEKRNYEQAYRHGHGSDSHGGRSRQSRPSGNNNYKSHPSRYGQHAGGSTHHQGGANAPQCSDEVPCGKEGTQVGAFTYRTSKGTVIPTRTARLVSPATISPNNNINMYSGVFTGPITSYGGNLAAGEACHYQDWQRSDQLYVAAIGHGKWYDSRSCGLCLRLKGDKHEGYVIVNNLCPECGNGLDLYEDTYGELMDGGMSEKSQQSWEAVNCALLYEGGLVVRMHESMTPYYAPFQVRNSFKPVVAAWFRRSGSSEQWTEAPLDPGYNHFVPGLYGNPIYSMDVRLQAFDGETIEVHELEIKAYNNYQLEINFSEDWPTSSASM